MFGDNRNTPIESHKRKFSDTTEEVKTGKSRVKKPCNKPIVKTAINQLYSPPTNQPPPIHGYANYSYYSHPNAAQYEYDYFAFQHQQPTTNYVTSNNVFDTTETYAAYF